MTMSTSQVNGDEQENLRSARPVGLFCMDSGSCSLFACFALQLASVQRPSIALASAHADIYGGPLFFVKIRATESQSFHYHEI